MAKRHVISILLFILIVILGGVYYNKTYLKEDNLNSDIERRIKSATKSNEVREYKILNQKEVDNDLIILYSYTANNLNLVDCSVYEKDKNDRYKFIKEQMPSEKYGTLMLTSGEKSYFIHFGDINNVDYSKCEVTYANKTVTKEYQVNEPFIEIYDITNGGVTIKPVNKE